MRRSTRKRNPPARLEDHDEPPPRKRQPQKKSQTPTAHKIHIPPTGSTQQHGLHSATLSPNSITSTSRAPTLLARASTSSPNSITSTSRAPTLPARASTSSPNSHTSTSRAPTLLARASTSSPNSHTSKSRAPTLPARASTSSPVTAIPQQADTAQQCLEKDIMLADRQDKMRRSTRKRKPPVRPENHDKTTLRKRQPQATPPHTALIIQREVRRQSRSPSVATSSSRQPTPPTRPPTPPHVISIPPQVDMAQQLLEQNIPLVNEQELEMTQSSDIEICRKAIIKNFVALKKYLHPDPIIDCDTGFELLNVADRRNIQGKDPTDKNETILRKVISKRAKGYTDFKERLKKTWQTELLELIVCAENGQDTKEIESRLRKTALLCPEYIKQRGGK
ncbi:serine/arginine repetitive matrix protein 1-like isoform X2 [Ruditapes philippinarum]|uniref:serine/arginine repetitive matrix protein 1-like isoform X2 n=1 Tax=Ruditapes philippinarum TaxID=129788 RepID=UPI00295B9B1E|nr:serine/arginine repetitive matrix protein 1-like isoform X2 [Ruditapes philippinarum]